MLAHQAVRLCLSSLLICSSISALEFSVGTSVPLGLTYDGRVVWIADARTKNLYGYDAEEKRPIRPVPIRISGLRDIDFLYPHLITVFPYHIAKIDPITGNVVEKTNLSKIADPVSIALDGEMAYIFNRADSRVYRFHVREKNIYGSFKVEVDNPRGMTYYRNYLWVIDKSGRVLKINAKSGETVSSIQLPDKSYGVTFIAGMMHISQPGSVRSIDFIETENYVASNLRELNFRGEIQIPLPWAAEQIKEEPELGLSLTAFPFSPRQRMRRIDAEPSDLRFRRDAEGSSTAKVEVRQNTKTLRYSLKTSFSVYSLTYTLQKDSIAAYFKRKALSPALLEYLEIPENSQELQTRLSPFISQWDREDDSVHPYVLPERWQKWQLKSLSDQLYFARASGIPARYIQVFNIKENKTEIFLQMYFDPVGWVTLTPDYDLSRPKEFPFSNNYIELDIPDKLQFLPEPIPTESVPRVQKSRLIWQNIVVIDSTNTGN
ncbi:MAG: hypothetical protein KDK38_04960 [Leptospiraceae bacterium]|nr:hypothetical protein [Leptospiraceae bacterium]